MDKKSGSDAKSSANRLNGRKATGPKNTASTRFNAQKHGLLSAGITDLDDAEGYRERLRRLNEAYFAELEAFLVERIALHMVRLRRSARLEAEFIRGILYPPAYGNSPLVDLSSYKQPLIDPGLPALLSRESVEALATTYHRYDSANENKLYRAVHELERLRRLKQGEAVPAPATLDVNVHSETRRPDPPVDSAERTVLGDLRSGPAGKKRDETEE